MRLSSLLLLHYRLYELPSLPEQNTLEKIKACQHPTMYHMNV